MAELPKTTTFNIHSITERTWDPKLPRDTRLLVPIHVDALIVRSERETAADCRMRTPEEGGSSRSLDLLPSPFTDHEEPRERGVHLHWAMPDGLASLRGEGANAAPPTLPDRWLVARVAPGASGRRRVRAWVLDSRNATQTELETWSPVAPSGNPVTALGIGDAGWAAYYDNVRNRFGFHDPLSDVTAGKIAYLVCGWYADPGLDPLANIATRHAFEARLAALGWDVPGSDLKRAHKHTKNRTTKLARAGLANPHAARDELGRAVFTRKTAVASAKGLPVAGKFELAQAYWPEHTLMHGAIVGLSWPNASDDSPDVGGPPDPSQIDVALGITPSDALAAIVAQRASSAETAEWLNAFALGALNELSEPDGDAKLDDRLHDAAFVSLSDGVERVRRPASVMPKKKPPPPKKTSPKSKYGVGSKGAKWGALTGAFIDAHKTVFGEASTIEEEAPEPAEIDLPRPRLYQPPDPVIAIHGAFRSPKHGFDGRYSTENKLMCRVSGTAVKALSLRVSESGNRRLVRATDLLERPLLHGGIPDECQELLEELGLLDLGSSSVIAATALRVERAAGALPVSTVQRIAETEQTAWWATRSKTSDARALAALSGYEGRLPSVIAIRPPAKPWVPLHLDWEIEFIPTPGRDWQPGEIEFAPPAVPSDRATEKFEGRCLLSPGVALALADSVEKYLADERAAGGTTLVDADDVDTAEDIVSRLRALDTLAGPLEGLHRLLRRDIPGTSTTSVAAPPGFVALRAGFLRLTRLRLVDAFGQVLDLAGSSATTNVDPDRVVIGPGADTPDAPGTLSLPPRFTAPAKLSFRYLDAELPSEDANDERSPVCGYLLPDHIDEALELFDATGAAIGQLRLDTEDGPVWEMAPGLPTSVGQAPRSAVAQPELAGFAQALFEQSVSDHAEGRTPGLAELLRAVDSTRWTVDPFAHVGEEHLSLLIGHPIAVVSASLRLEVREPATGTDVPITRVPVRLGALTHWQDGLFGFFVDGDFTRFHCASAAAAFARPSPSAGFLGPIESVPGYATSFAADVSGTEGDTPIDHPYVDASGVIWVVPNVTYELLLLMEPHCAVHATSCLLPRKQLAPRRAWMSDALARIAPTFRFGPVLREPKQIRMPIPADIEGAWTWTHRADVDRWVEEEVIHAGHEALLSPEPAVATEGWLKLGPKPESPKNGGG